MRNLGKYFDNKHFPRGFSRSGEFTIKEAQILEAYGRTMQGLMEQTISPEDEEEKLFLQALANEDDKSSVYANCWRKYMKKTQPRRSYTLCGTNKSSSSYDEDDDSIDIDSDALSIDD